MTIERWPAFRRGLVGLVLVAVAWEAACESTTEPDPPNRAPVAVGTLPDQTLIAGQQAASLDLSNYFDDPDGDALTYTVASTDPAVATAEVSGASLLITAVAAGKVTVTVLATDPGGLFAAQSTGVAVASENSAPVPVGSIPAQNLGAGTSVTLDLAGYFNDPDGDELGYEATSDNTDVATAGVAGRSVTISAVADGSTAVTVTATDPGGLSAEQRVEVVVGAGGAGFRDDFDAETLSGWDVTEAGAEVAEGVLRVTNTSAGVPGQVDRALVPKVTEWETRVMLGRASDSVVPRVVFSTSFPGVPAIAVEIGSMVIQGQNTNIRFLVLQNPPGEWLVVGGTDSEAISDSAGVLSEIRLSLKGTELRISVGDTPVFVDNLTGAPVELRELIAVGLWAVPIGNAAGGTALFDWVEVTGTPGGVPPYR